MSSENDPHEVEEYGDTGITSLDASVPTWLKFNYVIWPIWGIVWFCMFWNGSAGWFDRGYWNQLQRAANTTFPHYNAEDPTLVKPLQKNPEKPVEKI